MFGYAEQDRNVKVEPHSPTDVLGGLIDDSRDPDEVLDHGGRSEIEVINHHLPAFFSLCNVVILLSSRHYAILTHWSLFDSQNRTTILGAAVGFS